jgi:hypothetical protein
MAREVRRSRDRKKRGHVPHRKRVYQDDSAALAGMSRGQRIIPLSRPLSGDLPPLSRRGAQAI